MNYSFYSVDRATHLKIVVLALIVATAAVGIRVAAHSNAGSGLAQAEYTHVIKAGKPAMMTSNPQVTVR